MRPAGHASAATAPRSSARSATSSRTRAARARGRRRSRCAVRAEGGARTRAVSDEGPGLEPAEDAERAFERFWRAAAERPGSGLGLAIVRATAERHGGRAYARARGSRSSCPLSESSQSRRLQRRESLERTRREASFAHFRPRRLLVLISPSVALSAGGAALAVAAERRTAAPLRRRSRSRRRSTTPWPRSIRTGITARITFTNKLFPSGALLGRAGSSLMSGATGRLWVTDDGRGRLELQSDAGDAQIVWSRDRGDGLRRLVEHRLPGRSARAEGQRRPPDQGALPTRRPDQRLPHQGGPDVSVSDAQPVDVAGRAAYTVTVAPKHDGGLLGSVELAWDAENGVPLRSGDLRARRLLAGARARRQRHLATARSPRATSTSRLRQAPRSSSSIRARPRAPAADKGAPVTGLDAVQAAAGFPVAAPDSLVGLPLKDVRLVGGGLRRS